MSGPSRELPPLSVRILGDNSDALSAIKGVVTAAKAAGKAVGAVVIQQSSAINAAMATSIASYKKLAKAQEQYGRLTSTFRNMKGGKSGKGGSDLDALVGQANKRAVSAYTERVRRMRQLDKAANQDVVASNKKSQATIRDEQQQTVRFFRANAKAVHSDSVQNYGRLTPAFRGMKGAGAARGGMDLDALVGNAEKTAKAVANTETKVMAKAERERAQSVIGARNAQRKQAAEANKEAADAVKEKLRRDKQLDKAAKQSVEQEDKASRKKWQIWGRDAAQNIKNDNEVIASNARVSKQRWVTFGRDAAQNIKNDDRAIRDTNRAAENKAKTLQGIQDYFKKANDERLRASVAESLQNAKHDDKAIASTKKATESRAKAIQGIRDHFARAHRERLQQMGRELTQQAKNDAADIRYRQAQERAAARAARRAQGPGRGDTMMSSRADMYMHSAAIGNITSGMRSVLEPWAQLESHIATIKVFAGTIEKARGIADEMQQFALVSPYSLNSVMEATSLLMKFGQSSEDAMSTVKMLGDVAGGNSERLKHVALGVAQAVSLGRLQGQELRQMTEGGFNPLRIAAEHTAGPGADEKAIKAKMAMFDDLMRKRKLDAKFVTAALQLTTSKGGKHAGAVKEQSQTPIGLATQIMESVSLISIEAVKLFDAELRQMLGTTLEMITRFIRWMKVNKDTVASIALLTAKIVGALLAFHALSFAIAGSRWMLHSFFGLFRLGYAVIYGLVSAVWALSAAFTAEGAAAFSAWMATLGPVAWITAAVLGLVATVSVLGITIAALGNDKGLEGVFNNIYTFGEFLVGFFANFSQNMPHLFEFIAANWRIMIWDMIVTLDKALTVMAEMIGRMAMKIPQMIMDNAALLNPFASTQLSGQAGDGKGGYDTSMLNLSSNPLAFLNPFASTGDSVNVPDTPNINFMDYVNNGPEGPGGKKGRKGAVHTRDHALVGSNEQAQRMYDYSQAMMGSTGAVTRENAPQKQVALLEQIARNTQPDFDRGDSIGDMDID
jgi:hypothetical protein